MYASPKFVSLHSLLHCHLGCPLLERRFLFTPAEGPPISRLLQETRKRRRDTQQLLPDANHSWVICMRPVEWGNFSRLKLQTRSASHSQLSHKSTQEGQA